MTQLLTFPANENATTASTMALKIPGPKAEFEGQSIGTFTWISIPADEVWLWQNPDILKEVLGGLREAVRGETEEVSYLEFVDPQDG